VLLLELFPIEEIKSVLEKRDNNQRRWAFIAGGGALS